MANPDRTAAVVNLHKVMPGQFAIDPDLDFSVNSLFSRILSLCRNDFCLAADTTRAAQALLGDGIFANMMLLGMAWQMGRVPLTDADIEEAIRPNGRAVERNIAAFRWGRALAHDEHLRARFGEREPQGDDDADLAAIVEEGRALLRAWQNEKVAASYADFIDRVAGRERMVVNDDALARAVARQLARLTAMKDEYEVARLYAADRAFFDSIAQRFGRNARVRPWLAPPLLAPRGPDGRPRKRAYGPWIWRMMPVLARMKVLRGTLLDPFGWTAERRAERRIPSRYRSISEQVLEKLDATNHAEAVSIARSAARIRGFGRVRLENFTAWEREASNRLSRMG
jgi:indolepyruvate ferredoxin oxidoreductase